MEYKDLKNRLSVNRNELEVILEYFEIYDKTKEELIERLTHIDPHGRCTDYNLNAKLSYKDFLEILDIDKLKTELIDKFAYINADEICKDLEKFE